MTSRESQLMLKNAALNLLARREYSRQELFEKLSRHNEASELLEDVLNDLAAQSLQSDERFCESFIRYRIAQGKGPYRIRMELHQKGIDADLIDHCLVQDESFWREQAKEIVARKFARETWVRGELDELAPEEKAKQQAKCARFLASRGFAYSMVSDVLPFR